MRCIVCDYSDTGPKSLYYGSLVDPKGSRHRRVYYNVELMEEICTVCEEKMKEFTGEDNGSSL